MFDFWRGEHLGEGVGDHVICRAEYELNFAIINYPPDEVKMDVYMLGVCMILVVLGECRKVVGSLREMRTSPIKECSHSASFVACVTAMYLLSVVESETISCFFEAQDTAPLSMRNA